MADSVGLSYRPLSFAGVEPHLRAAVAADTISGQYAGGLAPVGLKSLPFHLQTGPAKPSSATLASGQPFGRKLYVDNFFSSGSLLSQPFNSTFSATSPPSPPPEDTQDIIPTAIVIKNIPFSVKREALLAVMESLGLPKPYAFNYHFDSGVFRGLAFANFRMADETDVVVQTLNGFDILGRKLRVEYKKVLSQAEREKKEAEKFAQQHQPAEFEKKDRNGGLFEGDVRMTQRWIEDKDLKPYESQSTGPVFRNSSPPSPPTVVPTLTRRNSAKDLQSFHNTQDQLDMNDPETLKFYEVVVLFNSDKFRNELVFPPTLSSRQRRILHLVAQKLDLFHFTEGEGDERRLKIVRKPAASSSELKPQVRQTRSFSQVPTPKPNLFLGSNLSSKGLSSTPNMPISRSVIRRNSTSADSSSLGIVFPIRQPKGPDPTNNFANRSPTSRGRMSGGDAGVTAVSKPMVISDQLFAANNGNNQTSGRQRAASIDVFSSSGGGLTSMAGTGATNNGFRTFY